MVRTFVRTVGAVAAAIALVAFVACEGDVGPTGPAGADGAAGPAGPQGPAGPPGATSFSSALDAASEVPTNASTATGTASLALVGNILLFRVDVSGISNVSAAHIHGPAAAGVNGPVRVNLCGAAGVPACPSGTNYTGVLATGFATAASGISFDSLVVILRNGNTYINVHTNDNVPPTNTGPGDLASGEIRGQIVVQ